MTTTKFQSIERRPVPDMPSKSCVAIHRLPGGGGFLWGVATSRDLSLDLPGQARDAMAVIDGYLDEAGIDRRAIEQRFDLDFATYFAEDLRRLAEHEQHGLVTVADDAIQATPEGELFIRNLAMCFDVHWREKHEGKGKNLFSKTV